jgi:hypothetical protein
MKQIRISVLLVLVTGLGATTMRAAGKATIKGYVIDSSCTFTKDLKKPVNSECAVACAKAGSPLVIQAVSGVIYLPISGGVPASGQNDKLMPFAGQKVTVTGTVYSRGGSHAIVIDRIEGGRKALAADRAGNLRLVASGSTRALRLQPNLRTTIRYLGTICEAA